MDSKRAITALTSDAGCGTAGAATLSTVMLIARKAGLLGRCPA